MDFLRRDFSSELRSVGNRPIAPDFDFRMPFLMSLTVMPLVLADGGDKVVFDKSVGRDEIRWEKRESIRLVSVCALYVTK